MRGYADDAKVAKAIQLYLGEAADIFFSQNGAGD
jgi:hypothetical protein